MRRSGKRMSPDPISVFAKIMAALRLRYRFLNLHYEAAWTDSWTHRRCLHEHQTLIEAAKCAMPRGAGWYVVAENKSDSVVFMVHPRLIRGKGGDDVTPIFWSDNCFSLLPGEKKTVTARFDSASLQGATPELVVEGWNVEPTAP